MVRAKLTGGDDGGVGDPAFAEIQGILWCKLADYYTRLGSFERARSIYEEGMISVNKVRDFGLIFDAYSRFEEVSLDMVEVIQSTRRHFPSYHTHSHAHTHKHRKL